MERAYTEHMLFQLSLAFLGGIAVARLQRTIMKNMRVKKSAPKAGKRNIGLLDRGVRLTIGIVLVVYAIWFGSWIAMLFAGYSIYEAFSKWCGFYALIGRNTCPIN